MYFKQRQKIFDDVKWYDSVSAREDQCGKYVFCGKCDKGRKYPCARAEHRYNTGYIRVAIVCRHK